MIKTVKINSCPDKLALAKAIKDVVNCPGPTATTLALNKVITLNNCPLNEEHWSEITKLCPDVKWTYLSNNTQASV